MGYKIPLIDIRIGLCGLHVTLNWKPNQINKPERINAISSTNRALCSFVHGFCLFCTDYVQSQFKDNTILEIRFAVHSLECPLGHSPRRDRFD